MVPDCITHKQRLATSLANAFDAKSGTMKPVVNEYSIPKDHEFRKEAEMELGQKDF